MSRKRSFDRNRDQMRPVTVELDVLKFAEGSAMIRIGDTQVLAAASIESRVPRFLDDSGQGWLTAEYAMLPRATQTRNQREVSRGRPSGRTAEIQRLIGRSLRAAVDLKAMEGKTLTVDCDVLQADGGTRCASITAGYIAAVSALSRTFVAGDLSRWPVTDEVAAISIGIFGGEILLDLDYSEDRDAAVDMNLVATGSGRLVEIQGTGEERSFSRQELDELLELGMAGLRELVGVQNEVLAPRLAPVNEILGRGSRRPAEPKDESELWGAPEKLS